MEADLAIPMVEKSLGCVDYAQALADMRAFTAQRGANTPDELWQLEHPPVYTLGQGADPAHGPRQADGIPVLRVERGGEVTYHGPGQLVIYTLVDIARRGIKVREYVRLLEECIIELLEARGIRAVRKVGAPGVYVSGAKIAALGLRVSRGRVLHGLSLNVDMDLTPFAAINPCGMPGLAVTQMRDLGVTDHLDVLGAELSLRIIRRLEVHHA